MPDRNPARLTVPLSEEEIDELDDFLMSDAVTDEAMMLDQLDGYLTAIIIGPVTLRMQDWLPGIWGGRARNLRPNSRPWSRPSASST